jgi:hypothetical protein
MHEHNIPYEERSVANALYRDELVELGGRMQVPFFCGYRTQDLNV